MEEKIWLRKGISSLLLCLTEAIAEIEAFLDAAAAGLSPGNVPPITLSFGRGNRGGGGRKKKGE